MYKLKVWAGRSWHWGIKSYDTIEAASKRVEELKAVGIKAKIAPSSELYN